MVIKHKINTSLEDAYYNILWRLDNVGVNYETENHIVPKWDPNARDEYGNQYPKPDPDTVGTGTAWIKILFKDRKQVLVYFCCHLVECKTCTYDRFITVYNYTDDIGDTNLQCMLPWLTLEHLSNIESTTGKQMIYFDIVNKETTNVKYYAPVATIKSETKCTHPGCVNGTITTEITVPRGNDNTYMPAPTIKVNTICPACNGTGKKNSIKELVDGGTLNFYEFYIKTDSWPYKEKITDFNTRVYIDGTTYRPLNSLEDVYALIEKTNAENEGKEPYYQKDLSQYIFPIPVFDKITTKNLETDEITTKWIIKDYRYYQTNYTDKDGNLIPLKAYVWWQKPEDSEFRTDQDTYNNLGVSDVYTTGYPTWQNKQIFVIENNYRQNYEYKNGGIKNFLKHCGEIETSDGTLHTPLIETYTDVSDTDKIWNFICQKDKNLPIFPFSNNTLYVSETNNPFKVDLYKNNNLVFKNILAQKTASNNSPLDSKLLKPTNPWPEPDDRTSSIYPIDYFYGTTRITNFSDDNQDYDPKYGKWLNFINASNNSTIAYRNSYGDDTVDAYDQNAIPGLAFTNYTRSLVVTFKCHITIPEDKINKYIRPPESDTDSLTIFKLNIGYAYINEDGTSDDFPNTITYTDGFIDSPYIFNLNIPTRKVLNSEKYDADNNLYYEWPTAFTLTCTAVIDTRLNHNFYLPIKNIHFCFSLIPQTVNNPYDIKAMDINTEIIALSNIPTRGITDNTQKRSTEQYTNISLLPKIEYNYNNYPEGVFNYYQNKFDTSIENYIFYKYNNNKSVYYDIGLMSSETTDNGIALIPDTIESQKKYKGFLNIMYQRKLRSIYAKQDSREDYFTCPVCLGNEQVKCDYCNGKRRLRMYDYNLNPNYNPKNADNGPEVLVRYPCPAYVDGSVDHDEGICTDNRCRICAGTKSMVRYYYYNALEFKDLTVYNGKTPVDVPSLSDLDDLNIKNRVLTNTVTEKGSKLSEPYINYLIRKYYSVPVEGTEKDFDKYYEYYNLAINNTVFYILNGQFTSYYYHIGSGQHIKVDYGYNYIYSTVTVDKKTWDKNESQYQNDTVLYRVISNADDVDNIIGFYVITETDVKTQDDDFANARVQRIYFDKNWVYTNILKDMTFNKFNTFTEEQHNVVGKYQDFITKEYRSDVTGKMYAHVHDDTEKIVETRCTTCDGTGVDPEDETKPCPLCGGTGDYPNDLQPESLYYEKAVYAYSSSEYINTNNISFEVDDQVSVDDLEVHEE